MKGYLLSGLGDYSRAIETYLERPTGKTTNWMLGYNYGKYGMTDEAERILNFHLTKRETQYVPAFMIAAIYIGLEDKSKALDWLRKDFEDGGLGLFFWGLKSDPKFDPVRNEMEFVELLNKIK